MDEMDTKRKWTQQQRADLASGKIKGAFAGPDQSYPIAGPGDVGDAWGLAGHADSPDAVRKRIISIAKRFGWTSGLPKAARAWAEERNISLGKSLAFKFVDDEQRIIEGYAATWDEDDEGETFDPSCDFGLDRYLKRPVLLLRHGRDGKAKSIPIGRVLEVKRDEMGLWVRAQLYKGQEIADYAWSLIKQGVRNFSVGALTEKVRKLGRRIMAWPLVEISVEDFAANPHARFEIAKSMYAELAKELGITVAELEGTEREPEGPLAEATAEPEPTTGNGEPDEAQVTEPKQEVTEMAEEKQAPTIDVEAIEKRVSETASKAFRLRGDSVTCNRLPTVKSIIVDSASRNRNRQSHQP